MPGDALSGGETYSNPGGSKWGSVTASAGTAITKLIDPFANYKIRVNEFLYETGATAHDVYVMTTLDSSRASGSAASGQAVLPVDAQLTSREDGTNVLGANDYVIVKHADGTHGVYVVSSVSNSGLVITLASNLTKQVLAGSLVYMMGVVADHADRKYSIVASNTRPTRPRLVAPLAEEPVLFYSANATNAGVLVYTDAEYIKTAA